VRFLFGRVGIGEDAGWISFDFQFSLHFSLSVGMVLINMLISLMKSEVSSQGREKLDSVDLSQKSGSASLKNLTERIIRS